MIRGKYCACYMNGVTRPSDFMNNVTRPSDFMNGVTRPSDGVSSRCLRCQIFEGGVGLAGVGVGGQNPSCRGVYFSLLFPQENFVPPAVNVLLFPNSKV